MVFSIKIFINLSTGTIAWKVLDPLRLDNIGHKPECYDKICKYHSVQ